MPVEQTLARVEADLARGEVAMARQRLRGLIGSYPHRLDLRNRLAQVYRDGGDLAQAGRWSYLSEQTIAAGAAGLHPAVLRRRAADDGHAGLARHRGRRAHR